MTNILYLANTANEADGFFKELSANSLLEKYVKKDMRAQTGNLVLWGVGLTSTSFGTLPKIKYVVDNSYIKTRKMQMKRDAVMIKLAENAKEIGESRLIEMLRKEIEKSRGDSNGKSEH
jgi:hypothetical protein